MIKVSFRSRLAAGAVVIVAVTAGCRADLGAPASDPSAGAVSFTEQAAASMLVVVTGPAGANQLASQAVAAAARPEEDLEVLAAGAWGRPLVVRDAPPPVTVTVTGKPAPLIRGASSYQRAQHQQALTRWRNRLAAGKRSAAARTAAATAAWARRLRLGTVIGSHSASPAAANLPGECALAVGTVSGLVNQAGHRFGTRRVLLLAAASLSGLPPAGELDGDDVIVTTPYLPTAAAASAAQENLLAAGATRAAILGPEVSAGQLAQLITDGLSQNAVTDVLSGPALFANNSSVLLPTAAAALTPLIRPLSRPGVCGVINGYASVPGGTRRNQALSVARAAAVSRFLTAHGVPATCLQVAGHGATRQFGSGDSSDNRRVVVVLEEPSS